MNDKAEKVYAEAFFELCTEEAPERLGDILGEMDALEKVFNEEPEFIKLLGTPTVTMEEKLAMVRDVISEGKISGLTGNLLCVLTERGRMNCFSGILKDFRASYNDYFKIAEITVTSSAPLSEAVIEKIRAKMTEVTGRTVSIREKVDPALIGGVVIDYGSTRWDGSIRSRLAGLRRELGGVIV